METTYGELSSRENRFLHQTHTFEQFRSVLLVTNEKHEQKLPIEEDVVRFLYWQLDGNMALFFKTLLSVYNQFKYKIRDSIITHSFGVSEMRNWFESDEYFKIMKLTWLDISPYNNDIPFANDKEKMKKFKQAINQQDISEFLSKIDENHNLHLWTTVSSTGKPKFCPLFKQLYEKFY
jgi:hypothetical protein